MKFYQNVHTYNERRTNNIPVYCEYDKPEILQKLSMTVYTLHNELCSNNTFSERKFNKGISLFWARQH